MSEPAFRAIGEVASSLGVAPHVLRFWEGKFPEVAPVKRAGGRRFYRAADVALLTALARLLHARGFTLRGVRAILDTGGVAAVLAEAGTPAAASPKAAEDWRAELTAARAALAVALAEYRAG